jgi:hypothetical protein
MKPIIFSAEMVRAILDGRKTQARRVIKVDPDVELELYGGAWRYYSTSRAEYVYVRPRYNAGDILWVREGFAQEGIFWAYKADVRDNNTVGANNLAMTLAPTFYADTLKWQPPIHMPRAAARIFLRVTDVRAERLQDISPADVVDEGVDVTGVKIPGVLNHEAFGDSVPVPRDFEEQTEEQQNEYFKSMATAVIIARSTVEKSVILLYKNLWNSINAKRGYGWNKNPWVWAYTFERISAKEARGE